MLQKTTYLLLLIIGLLSSCTNTTQESKSEGSEKIENPTNKIFLSSEIVWEKLNPARGDQSPQAGTIWGDRKGTVATGFLVKFIDGFSSPPHIHNVTYRAIVIKGLIHNDDSKAAKMWMPAGSFWTQPAGEVHITAAKGEENIAYVEIDSGPYLVKPVDESFDKGERPVNIDKSNIVWLDSIDSLIVKKTNDENSKESAKVAYLWESGDLRGYMIKLPKGFKGEIKSSGEEFQAIVVSGNPKYKMPKSGEEKNLDSGSYFASTGTSTHKLSSNNGECVIYVRTNGKLSITGLKP